MEYAMLISVLHRNQQDFDGLLGFFLNYRNQNGLMCWQIRMNQQKGIYVNEDGQTNATDGDIDIATSLYLACKLFPNGSSKFPNGAYQYRANQLTSCILKFNIHPHLNTPFLGDWVNQDSKQAKRLYDSTRTSDFILSSFLLFSRLHPDSNERNRWCKVIQSIVSIIDQNKGTLLPDFLEWNSSSKHWIPVRGKLLESQNDGQVNWNACRTPWRLSHFYAVTRDSTVQTYLQSIHSTLVLNPQLNFPFTPAGINIYSVTPLVDYSDKAFIAPVGYLCYVLGDSSNHRKSVQALE